MKLAELPKGKPDRGIQASPIENLAALRHIYRKIEDIVFHSKYTIKHIPLQERSSYVKERLDGHRNYFAIDYSRFESSHKYPNMEACEIPFYSLFMDGYSLDEVKKIHKNMIAHNLFCTMESDNGIRASGDGDTSLGNTVTNIMLTAYIFHCLGIEWDGLFEGDDGLIAFDTTETEDAEAAFYTIGKAMGYELKLERRNSILESKFLSTFYGSETSWQDPNSVLMRLNASLKAYTSPELTQQLFNAKYLSCCYTNINAPVFGVLCMKEYDPSVGMALDVGHANSFYIEKYKFRDEWIAKHGLHCDVSMETRMEYAVTTGIAPSEQIFLEQGQDRLYTLFDLEQPENDYIADVCAGTDKITVQSDILKFDEFLLACKYVGLPLLH